MAKPKSPLLSLGAHGTIGDALTYQKRGREHIVREKPIPTDPYSLAQAYQRWDYKDYAYLWTLLSNAEKQVYRTRASRYHITGFSQWMREHLKNLTDIAGRWHLDEKSGAVAYDSSKNANNGIIVGASPVSGPIDGAFLFDGLNNQVNCGNDPSLDLGHLWTIDYFIRVHTFTDYRRIWDKRTDGANWINHQLVAPNKIYFWSMQGGAAQILIFLDNLVVETWYHVACTYDFLNQTARLYLDGQLITSDFAFLHPDTLNAVLTLGSLSPLGSYSHIDLDEFTFNTRILDQPTILRHSKRRYPA